MNANRTGPLDPHEQSLLAMLNLVQRCDITECNGNYQRLVHQRLGHLSADEMTLGEFAKLVELCNREFNTRPGAAAFSRPRIHLTSGDVLYIGDRCNVGNLPTCKTERAGTIVEILPGGGVDRCIVRLDNGQRVLAGRYHLSTGDKPTEDALAGMRWWNAMNDEERRRIADACGTGRAADCWAQFGRTGR